MPITCSGFDTLLSPAINTPRCLKCSSDLCRIKSIAVPPPRFGSDEDAIRFGVSVKKLRRLLLDFVGRRNRRPFFVRQMNVDEAIAHPGNKIELDLAGGAHDLTGSIDVAALRNPARHAATMPVSAFSMTHGNRFASIAMRKAAASKAKRFTTART